MKQEKKNKIEWAGLIRIAVTITLIGGLLVFVLG